MKTLILLILFSASALADTFSEEAPQVAGTLKKNLMGNLSQVIKEKGTAAAVNFCHLEVKNLAAKTGKEFKGKYLFGRTSHRIRNPKNAPEKWMEVYLANFQNKKQTDTKTQAFFHTTKNGERFYLEPLWVTPMCLQCHGQNVAKKTNTQILKNYPKDQARDFRVGDFRGFIWIKEKK